jgi:hypothetical protein
MRNPGRKNVTQWEKIFYTVDDEAAGEFSDSGKGAI